MNSIQQGFYPLFYSPLPGNGMTDTDTDTQDHAGKQVIPIRFMTVRLTILLRTCMLYRHRPRHISHLIGKCKLGDLVSRGR